MCLNFHNHAHRRAQEQKQESARGKSSTSTSPLQLQLQQQQQSNNVTVYDPLHDCYSAWLYRLKLHCSDLYLPNDDSYDDDEGEGDQDSNGNSDNMIDVPSRIARLDGVVDADEFLAELQELSGELVASSQDAQTNYAAGLCFDACIPRLFYFNKLRRTQQQPPQQQQQQAPTQTHQRQWEEMPEVTIENSVCEASLSDLFPIIHEAFLRPHGVHSDNIYVHFFYKIMPQRSVVRNYESMVKEHFFENAESRWLVDRLLLCTLLGAYKHADPTSRPGYQVRVQLYEMLSNPRRFYTQRYVRGNTHDTLWQADMSNTASLTPDVVDAFLSGLLQHCREVVMFAMREFLVYCIDDDPSMRQVAQAMFNYDRFRTVVLGTANKIRAYVAKNLATSGDATMSLQQLIRHGRHQHPHADVSDEPSAIDVKAQEEEEVVQPAAKRQRRSRRGGGGVNQDAAPTGTRRGKLKTGKIAMTCYEWDLAVLVKAPTNQLRLLSFQKPMDPITKAFDSVRNQIRRPVPWEKYRILPVRMYLKDKELLRLRDDLQISFHSHDPPDDLKMDGAASSDATDDFGAHTVDGENKKQRKKGSTAAEEDCQMKWDVLDKQRLECSQTYIRPLHPSLETQSLCVWQSANEWQTCLDSQMDNPVTQVYVTDMQITARHSYVMYRWLTQCTEATTPTVDLWNMFVEILPAFGVPPAACQRLVRMTEKYYPYRYTKESWVTAVNHLADHHVYTYVLVQAFVSMLKTVASTAVHKLPLNYREQQMSALNELAVKQMPKFASLDPEMSGALCMADETADFWFCSVCSTIYSLLDDPNSPYKHQYRLGLREAVFDFETGQTYCNRNGTNMHMHCQAQPLCRLPVIERLVQYKKAHLMLCPGCGVVMVLNTEQCSLVAGKGYICSSCTNQWRTALQMTMGAHGEPEQKEEKTPSGSERHQTLLQQATFCYICNIQTTTLWYYGPGTFLCRRHHRPSLARYLVQQSVLETKEARTEAMSDAPIVADPLNDRDWVRRMLHKFKDDFMERTATARRKYNDTVKRRVKRFRILSERR